MNDSDNNDAGVLVSGGNYEESINEVSDGMVVNYASQSTFDSELNGAGAGTSGRNDGRVIRAVTNNCEKCNKQLKNRIRVASHLKRCPRK